MGIQQLSELPGPLMFMSYLSIVFPLAFEVLLVSLLTAGRDVLVQRRRLHYALCVLKGYVQGWLSMPLFLINLTDPFFSSIYMLVVASLNSSIGCQSWGPFT